MKPKKDTIIEIIGAGVVGLATGKVLAKKGFTVFYTDINQKQINKIASQKIKISLPKKEDNPADISFICVPTPNKFNKIDLTCIQQSCKNLALSLKKKKKYHLIVIKSTILPGTTRNFVIPIIEKYSKKKAGKDFGVCCNPEYLRENTAIEDSFSPRIIIIGQLDRKSGNILKDIYSGFSCPIEMLTLEEAEFHKYIHNIYNANKIAFFNEMRTITRKLNIKHNTIDYIFKLTMLSSEAGYNPSYGIRNFGAFKGACLPKDLQAFITWAKTLSLNPILMSSIQKQNKLFSK
jgi:nucleotide sugar dehydrogenase